MKTLSYKDTDKDIEVEIYDLKFRIGNKIEDLDIGEINKKAKENEDIVKDIIDDILGTGSVEKINAKRKDDGYEVMSLQVQMGILTFLMQTYIEAVMKPVNKINDTFNRINHRNNYSRNYRRNNRYR